jgi:putative copper resistance protein D
MSSPAAAPARPADPVPGLRRPAGVPVGALVLAGLLAIPAAAAVGGAAASQAIGDPGAFVRWGLLYSRGLHDFAAAATAGLLVNAAFLVPETTRTNRRVTATRLAGVAAGLWALAGVATTVLTMADLSGTPLSDPSFSQQFTTFALRLEVTRVGLITAAVAAVVSIGALVAVSRAAMAWLAAIAVAGVLPLALAGHAAGSADHNTAVNALAVHLVSVVVWVGGLLALAILRPLLGRDLAPSAERFSVLAGWCFAAVGVSGVASAAIRLGGWGGLATTYGALILAKSTALVLLGCAGWMHRRSLLGRLRADAADGRAFLRLVLGELVVMGVAIGTAVALAHSAPPVPDTPLPNATAAFVLTGYPPPPPLTAASWFTTWRTDWLWLTVALVAVGLYLAGVRRLRRRGDAWPAHRTLLWLLGWAAFVYSTSGAPAVYGAVLFSAHMVMHMVVAMLIPLLLVPAAPILLSLRALPSRPDRTWGPRELVLEVGHSRAMRVLSNPVVAAALFFFSLAIFYYSPLFELALRTHTGHLLMIAHFLLTGYLFVWVLVGIDPGPRKWPPVILVVVLFATMSFHAFFGVVMTTGTTLLAPGFFEAIHLPWLTDQLADQHKAGAIAWGIGEAPTLALTLMVAMAWMRSDRAETRRRDRQADRDGDAELAAYNAHLAELRRRDDRQRRA